MSLAPLCPLCLASNIVATVKGPTCVHVKPSGVKWWPEKWDRMGEAERVEWLEKKQP